MGKRIFVGNLAFSTTSTDLETLFSEVGTCESATVVTDRETGRSRGFGFPRHRPRPSRRARRTQVPVSGRVPVAVHVATDTNDALQRAGRAVHPEPIAAVLRKHNVLPRLDLASDISDCGSHEPSFDV